MQDMARRYQEGTIEEVKTATAACWYIRFTDAGGKRPRFRIGLKKDLPTKAKASRAAQHYRDSFNGAPEQLLSLTRTFGDVIDRYEAEEMPARHSTLITYRKLHRVHLRPRWGSALLSDITPLEVRRWLLSIDCAGRTRGLIHSQMRMLYKFSMLWGWIPAQVNPLSLFSIPGSSKREKHPRIITPEQFRTMLTIERDPERRAMLVGVYCLGLRVSELLGLQWGDFDHFDATVRIQRAVVLGHEGKVKTDSSGAPLPLAKFVNETFLQWRKEATWKEETDWVFASKQQAGKNPKWANRLQQRWLIPLGQHPDLALPFQLGWHTFRHSYKTLLVECGIDVTIQRDLMRHADIHTTMQVYGENKFAPMRAANQKAIDRIMAGPID